MIPLLLALSCFPMDGPRLLARHLAAALTGFSQMWRRRSIGVRAVPRSGTYNSRRRAQAMASETRHRGDATAGRYLFRMADEPLESGSSGNSAFGHSLPEDARVGCWR